jgi:hypothetical protein
MSRRASVHLRAATDATSEGGQPRSTTMTAPHGPTHATRGCRRTSTALIPGVPPSPLPYLEAVAQLRGEQCVADGLSFALGAVGVAREELRVLEVALAEVEEVPQSASSHQVLLLLVPPVLHGAQQVIHRLALHLRVRSLQPRAPLAQLARGSAAPPSSLCRIAHSASQSCDRLRHASSSSPPQRDFGRRMRSRESARLSHKQP